MNKVITLIATLLLSMSVFSNEFNCDLTPEKVIRFAIADTKFDTHKSKLNTIIGLSRFFECTQSHDFWDAYQEYGHGRFGTAHGIYQKCILQTKIPQHCISDNFMELISNINASNLKCVSKLSHLVDNNYGAASKQYFYTGKSGSAELMGHSKLYYTNSNVKCETNRFNNCLQPERLHELCLSYFTSRN